MALRQRYDAVATVNELSSPRVEATLGQILRARAKEEPNRLAFVFAGDSEPAAAITYGELDGRARALAALLQDLGEPGDRLLLVYPAGLEFAIAFFACLYAGFVAVPAPPPESSRSRRHLSRIQSIVADARPAAALTTSAVLSGLAGAPELAGLPWSATDALDLGRAATWRPSDPDAESLAYLQYTSGSTATPKGVMVTQRALLHNSEHLRRSWGYGPASVSVMWVPNFHDDGLVHGIVQPVYSGFLCVLMPPSVIVEPIRWLTAVSRFRATHAGGPNFAYALAVRKITAEQRRGLDLVTWRMAYNAAEPIRRETLTDFYTAFRPCGFRWEAFYPSFGLAEATLLVSTRRTAAEPAFCTLEVAALEREGRLVEAPAGDRRDTRTLVGCGHPVEGAEIAIVEPETRRRCDAGEIGEIWIADSSVASGYWQRPEESERIFQARLASGEGPFLRTGDLGFLRRGELFITGRLKDLIIFRGRNIYPQDVELSVERSHPLARPGCAAAFSVEVEGEERLAVVQEVEPASETELDRVIESIRRQVAEDHDLPVHAVALLRPRTIPKTSSGKIQRHVCSHDFRHGELQILRAWTAPSVEAVAPEPRSASAYSPLDSRAAREHEESRRRADDLIGWLREFGASRINSRLMDERRSIPPHVVLELGNHGLLGMQARRSHGGLALTYRDAVRIYAQLAAIDLTVAAFVSGHNGLGVRPIDRHASAAVRDELLPSLASGREIAAFALTEPGAGSNPRAISARAEEDGEGRWRLFGHKVWIGSAAWAGAINVFVQHPEGLSGFVVRQGSPGLRMGPEVLTMGARGMVQSAVHLEGVAVGRHHLLGDLGSGLDVAQDAMMHARLYLGAMSVGGMKRCAQLMSRYASRRAVSTGRLLDNPLSLVRLGELTAAITALESLVRCTAELLDAGRPVPVEAFLGCKIAGSELLWRAADDLVQMLGGRGYIESNMAPQLLRDARMFRIVEGPTETLATFMGTRALYEGEELQNFLATGLGAPAVAARWREAIAAIGERWLKPSPFADRQAALRWSFLLSGQAAVAATLWAAAGAAQNPPSAALRRAVEWARERFERLVSRALAESLPKSTVLRPDVVAEEIAAYARDIGEVEQQAASEDWTMDPMLLLATSPDPSAPHKVPASQAAVAHEPDAYTGRRPPEKVISAWMVERIASQMNLDADDVDPSKPFAFYGLDSVTAVALLEKLGAWLGRRVAPTLAWSYPTIDSLARHLAVAGAQPGSPVVPGSAGHG